MEKLSHKGIPPANHPQNQRNYSKIKDTRDQAPSPEKTDRKLDINSSFAAQQKALRVDAEFELRNANSSKNSMRDEGFGRCFVGGRRGAGGWEI